MVAIGKNKILYIIELIINITYIIPHLRQSSYSYENIHPYRTL